MDKDTRLLVYLYCQDCGTYRWIPKGTVGYYKVGCDCGTEHFTVLRPLGYVMIYGDDA